MKTNDTIIQQQQIEHLNTQIDKLQKLYDDETVINKQHQIEVSIYISYHIHIYIYNDFDCINNYEEI